MYEKGGVIFKYPIHEIDVAYAPRDLPKELSDVHDVFHVSQLRKCVNKPEKHVSHEIVDVQPDLTYRERPVKI